MVKNPCAYAGDVGDLGLIPGAGRSPGGDLATHSTILGESHGHRNLKGYSTWDHRVRHDLRDLACRHTCSQ